MSVLPVRRIVIGSPDPAATLRFWARFGYEPVGDDENLLGCGRGAVIEVEETPVTGPVRSGWDLGPRGLDLYVPDLDAAVERLAGWKLACGPVADIAIGPVRMRQCAVAGPSGEPVVLVESTHRRPSLLDDAAHGADRWCSEVYSVVWCVDSRDETASKWTAAGAVAGPTMSFSDPSLGAYLGLPDAGAVLEMVTLSDAESSPTRLELLSFPGRQHAHRPAAAGVTRLEFADGTRLTTADR